MFYEHLVLKQNTIYNELYFLFFKYEPLLGSFTRTTDARSGNCPHCTAENPLPLPNFQVRPKHISSATSAQTFRYSKIMLSLGVRSPWIQSTFIPGYTMPLSIINRYLLRFFDCLAHPNLSATFATDQK